MPDYQSGAKATLPRRDNYLKLRAGALLFSPNSAVVIDDVGNLETVRLHDLPVILSKRPHSRNGRLGENRFHRASCSWA
jgi:hypothetical protein